MDWASRKVLSWRLSNTMDTTFCIDALEEAVHLYGKPDIFNTDQGVQFTSNDFINTLKSHDIQIFMNGKGCWMNNVFIERLWRSLKYECIYLQKFNYVSQLKSAIATWFKFYNNKDHLQHLLNLLQKRFIIEVILLVQSYRITSLQFNFKYEIYPQ